MRQQISRRPSCENSNVVQENKSNVANSIVSNSNVSNSNENRSNETLPVGISTPMRSGQTSGPASMTEEEVDRDFWNLVRQKSRIFAN